jgi:hypothetical protein
MGFQRGKAVTGNSVRPTRRFLFIQARPVELEVIERLRSSSISR